MLYMLAMHFLGGCSLLFVQRLVAAVYMYSELMCSLTLTKYENLILVIQINSKAFGKDQVRATRGEDLPNDQSTSTEQI
jgi:hypothetical protein